MTHNELMARIENYKYPRFKGYDDEIKDALCAVVELCATLDEVTIGDKGLFNSGRNSLREEITQAIEKELG